MAPADEGSFGALLRRLRLAAGLTQEDLAERAGLSSKAISGLERDPVRLPRLDTVALLAEALGLNGEQRAGLLAAARPRNAPPPGSPPMEGPKLRLPRPLSPLFGRTEDVEAVIGLLQRNERHLVTLIGPGGVGKTRLALRVAERLGEDAAPVVADGAVFIDLAPVRDPALVLPAVARALGVAEARDRPLLEGLIAYLHLKNLLLVVDNCEQVSAAGPALLAVLEACRGLTVLATSREPLRLRGEQIYRVPPLALPDHALSLQVATRSPAVALFLERADAAGARLRLDTATAAAVAAICRRLDGLPLAIELAAAWARVFPPPALLQRLAGDGHGAAAASPLQLPGGAARDAPVRHQTVEQAIDWSYRLLSADEQRLFVRLAVFTGGWTLEAAEAVCGADDLAVLEGIASLVDKSLVWQEEGPEGEPRFGMLETIGAFTRTQLAALGEAARPVQRRHAAYFLRMAREAQAAYWGVERPLWQRRLNTDLNNLHAAMIWSTDQGEVETALRLGGALFWFWLEGGHWREAHDLLERALAAATPAHRTAGRAAALNAAGLCNWSLGNVEVARIHSEESLSISRELGDRRGMGHALHGLGVLASEQGDLARARALIEEGMSHSEAAGDRPFVGLALHNLGLFAVREHDEQTARAYIEASRRVWQELGNTPFLSMVASSLGDLERSRGRFAAAATHYRESLALVGAGPLEWRASALHNLGHVTYRQGDERQARALLAEALVLCREGGDRRGVAECVAGLACVAAREQPERAARWLGAAMVIIEATGPHLSRASQADYDHALAIVRSRLDDEAFEAAWAQGRALTLGEAVAEALQEQPVRDARMSVAPTERAR